MNNPTNGKAADSIIVTLQSLEYWITAGSSVEIAVHIENPGSTGDYFKASLLGIPPGWITYSGPAAFWVPASGQEEVTFTIHPPAVFEGASESYLARLQVFSQSTPEKGEELEIQLHITLAAKTNQAIQIRTGANQYKAIPGSEVKIPLIISNISTTAETLELSVQGVPASWVAIPSPVVTLPGKGEAKVDISLQVPSASDIRAGAFPLKITATSQNEPTVKFEAESKLLIAIFESPGRVGVMLNSMHFSAAPGGSLTIPITVLNRGLESDAFRLGVEGIPASWASTSTALTPLEPGETKEISLVVRPPIAPTSQAGRNKFTILVASQKYPDQIVRAECLLTVAAFTQFSAELEPKEVPAGHLVSVRVTNQGNTQQVFHLSCTSQQDLLWFDFLQPVRSISPGSIAQTENGLASSPTRSTKITTGESTEDPKVVSIPAGASAAFRFTARPRQRPLIASRSTYAYQAVVKSQQQEAPPLPGQVIGRGIIPIWVLPIVLILCLTVFITTIFAFRDGKQSGSATQTWVAESTWMAGATQTVSANQTAAAIAGQLDTDGDGLTDQYETSHNTDPYNPDSDGDRSWDGVEVQAGTNPMVPDTDADGLQDGAESLPCPDPLNPDSDKDGIVDGKDLNPCDSNNPALTETALSLLPTATAIPPTATSTPMPATPAPTSVVLPRFGGVLLFTSDRDGNPEIYTLDDAGHINRLTNHQAADTQAVWDPSMQRIAFTTNRDGNNEIYLMNADGTNLVNLTNNPADDQQPAWSVDGQRIVFSSNRDGNVEVYLLRLSDAEVINLTNHPGNDTQPNWVRSTTFDPLGESILFTSDRDGNQEIYRMPTDGSEAINLTANPASDQMAKGSPDGALVVFTTNRDGNQEIYSMRIDGAAQAKQTNHVAGDFGPAWSSNQAWIAFTSDRDGNREVYITKPGNLELYNLTHSPSQDQVTDWR
jgi:uncharacterized membrane protein